MVPYTKAMFLALAAFPLACARPAEVAATGPGARVLVIANVADRDSVALARYYVQKRGVPTANLVFVTTFAGEEIGQAEFVATIETPVKAALARTKNPIDYLLLVRGVPARVREGGYSVDSLLMSEGVPTQDVPGAGALAPNPYFAKAEPFSHAKHGFYLACRLDGYTLADARALVDRSLAAKPNKGPFLLDEAENRRAESYGALQATLPRAAALLKAKGLGVRLDEDKAFAASTVPLAGYVGWGSNDGAFDLKAYRALRFLPGAVCETFVSTSGRTFRPTTGGQSLVADLVAQGVTGVKGYVSEPYTLALAKADLLLDRYTSGFDLADSFYAASPVIHWKDVVIGDPLCAPYRR